MKKRSESGEVMLEGMIIMVITMLLMIWLLAVGFIFYQRNLVTAITNDAAAKVAATYNNPSSDLIMGYISAEAIANRDLYRWFDQGQLHDLNEKKASAYINYMLNRTNFAGTIDNVEVKLEFISDTALRKHIKITTLCTFNTPFGEAMEVFGMDRQATYTAVSRADCTDIIDYVTTIDFASHYLSGDAIGVKPVKLLNAFAKFIDSVMEAMKIEYI